MSTMFSEDRDQLRKEAWNEARSLSIDRLKDRISDFENHEARIREQMDECQGELNGLVWKLPGDALDGSDLGDEGTDRLREAIDRELGSETAETWDELVARRDRLRDRHVAVCVRGTALQKQLALRFERYGAEGAIPPWSEIDADLFEALPVGDALAERLEIHTSSTDSRPGS